MVADGSKSASCSLLGINKNGLLELINVASNLSTSLVEFDFFNLLHVDKLFRVPITAYTDTKEVGMILSEEREKFEWRLTNAKWKECSLRLKDLFLGIELSDTAKAIYLDSNHLDSIIQNIPIDSFSVVVSYKGYTTEYWQEHFLSINGEHIDS